MKSNQNAARILCVANWPSDVGYAWWLMESYWSQIAHAYAHNYETLISFPTLNALPDIIQKSPIQSLEFAFSRHSIAGLIDNVKFIRKHNIKVIYFSDYPVTSWRYAIYRLAGVKTIITHDHTPGLRTPPKGIKKQIKSLLSRLPLINVTAAFGATDYVTKRLNEVACFPAHKCYSVQNGIRLDDHNGENQYERMLKAFAEDGYKIIITAARANRYKGVGFALDVIEHIVKHSKNAKVKYVFCGDGPHLDEFKQQAKDLNIAHAVHFLGRVENVTSLYQYCYAGFQPSSGEVGYSLSILEYMYHRLPVIVPNNPSVCGATVSDWNGYVYDDQNVASAADAITRYLDDPSLQKTQGENAYQDIINRYSLESTHKALLVALAHNVGAQTVQSDSDDN